MRVRLKVEEAAELHLMVDTIERNKTRFPENRRALVFAAGRRVRGALERRGWRFRDFSVAGDVVPGWEGSRRQCDVMLEFDLPLAEAAALERAVVWVHERTKEAAPKDLVNAGRALKKRLEGCGAVLGRSGECWTHQSKRLLPL